MSFRRTARASGWRIDTAQNVQATPAQTQGSNVALGTKWPLLPDIAARVLSISGQMIPSEPAISLSDFQLFAYLLDATLAQIKNADGIPLLINFKTWNISAGTGGVQNDIAGPGGVFGANLGISGDLLEVVSGMGVSGYSANSGVLLGGIQLGASMDYYNAHATDTINTRLLMNAVVSFVPMER